MSARRLMRQDGEHTLRRVDTNRQGTFRPVCSCGWKSGRWAFTERKAQDWFLDHVLDQRFRERINYDAAQ